jgi:uncharacterized membrane protein YcfT
VPAVAAPSTPRLEWADAAKGVCIALVVLHHLVTKSYDQLMPEGLVGSVWLATTEWLTPLRMPLFFVISGMFAASAVHRPWRAVARRRIATPYYLYVVWLLIHAVVFSFATALPMNRTQSLSELVGDLAVASTQLWYLYALAVYFVLAKLLSTLDRRWVLGCAAAVSAITSLLPVEAANRESVLQHFVYFLAGVLLPGLVRGIAEVRSRHLTPALTAGVVVAATGSAALGLPESAATLLVSLAGVPLAIRLMAAATTRQWFAVPVAELGRRTLPVYVMHVPLLSLLHHVVVPLWDEPTTATGAAAAAIYPIVATAAVIGACLLLHSVLVRGGLGLLFTLPARSEHGDEHRSRQGHESDRRREQRRGRQ